MRRLFTAALSLSVVALVASCGDSRSTDPSSLSLPADPQRAITPGTCTTLSELTSQIGVVFSSGPNANSALSKLNNADKKLKKGDLASAQSEMRNLISFIELKAGQGQLGGTKAQVQALIDNLLCYAGITTKTVLIYPTDQPQVITAPGGQAGVSLQGNTVGTPTLLTITLLDPNGPSPLITKLDKYPGYVQLEASSPLTKPAIVAVCPTGPIPSVVVPRLRLGHQGSAGFEITPPADASFLTCGATVGAARTPGLIRRLANLFLPSTAYATTMMGGGVGGVASEFSPFGPVDTELSFTGGVGGTSTEFMRSHEGSTRTLPELSRSLGSTGALNGTLAALTCSSTSAPAGTALAPECRPLVTITTFNGTIMQNVPVSWAVTAGGGTIAPNNSTTNVCGTFGSSASNATDVNGKASVCWTLGSSPGTNTVTATPSAGGDAPLGVSFSPATMYFNATGTAVTPTASATGANVSYDALPHAGSGSCSNSLTPTLSYSSVGVPVNAGTYTVTVTCGGVPGYNVATATASIVINKLPATASAGSGAMFVGGTPALPCIVSGLLPTQAGAVTCTSTVTTPTPVGVNTVTPTLSPASPTNYQVSLVNGSLAVTYKQSGCFAAPLSPTLPPVTQYIVRNSTIAVRCTLNDAANQLATGATGSILVQDIGTNGLATPVTIVSVPNAFTQMGSTYGYDLSTASPAYLFGHYFRVTATWNDGTTSVGYFYLPN